MPVTQRVNDAIAVTDHGEIAGSATAAQMPEIAAKWVKFKAASDNAGSVYVGLSSSVTARTGSTNTTAGLELAASEETDWLPCPAGTIDAFWYICDNAGDDLTYFILS